MKSVHLLDSSVELILPTVRERSSALLRSQHQERPAAPHTAGRGAPPPGRATRRAPLGEHVRTSRAHASNPCLCCMFVCWRAQSCTRILQGCCCCTSPSGGAGPETGRGCWWSAQLTGSCLKTVYQSATKLNDVFNKARGNNKTLLTCFYDCLD